MGRRFRDTALRAELEAAKTPSTAHYFFKGIGPLLEEGLFVGFGLFTMACIAWTIVCGLGLFLELFAYIAMESKGDLVKLGSPWVWAPGLYSLGWLTWWLFDRAVDHGRDS